MILASKIIIIFDAWLEGSPCVDLVSPAQPDFLSDQYIILSFLLLILLRMKRHMLAILFFMPPIQAG